VLVVDDTLSVAASTVEALQAAGVRAHVATTSTEALAAIESKHVDVCVMDLVMPGEDGAHVSRNLRARLPGLLLIAMSGHDVPELVRRIAELGVETVLRKPFSMRELVRSIAVARGRPARKQV
jgi:CheY-like chemotaxis protein